MKKRSFLIGVTLILWLTVLCGADETCQGDLDCDGDVDAADLATFSAEFGTTGCPAPPSWTQVINPCNCSEDASNIQQAIDGMPAAGGTLYLRAGSYRLTSGIHIHRSNTTVMGERGTLLRLGAQVNQPVILVGSELRSPTGNDVIQNITVANLEIDGNRVNQDSEVDPQRAWIRNNGIDVRAVESLWIQNVNIHDGRSGGIVVSWSCRSIFISNSSFHHNHFDGIALYDSEDILVSNFLTFGNVHGAGISLDNDLGRVSFHGGLVRSNGDVGIFARHCHAIGFHDLMVSENASHGVFLSHESLANNTGVKQLFFQGCSFSENAGYGFWLASPNSDSPGNAVIGCLFEANATGCINLDPAASLFQAAVVCSAAGGNS